MTVKSNPKPPMSGLVQPKEKKIYTKNFMPKWRYNQIKIKRRMTQVPSPRSKGLSKTDQYITMQGGHLGNDNEIDLSAFAQEILSRDVYVEIEEDLRSLDVVLKNVVKQGAVVSVEEELDGRVSGLIDKLSDAGINNTDHVTAKVQEILNKIDTITDKSFKVDHNVNIGGDYIKPVMMFISEHKPLIGVLFIVALAAYAIKYEGKYTFLLRTLIGVAIGIIGYVSDLGIWLTNLLKYVTEFISSKCKFEQQAFNGIEDCLPTLGLIGVFTSIFKGMKYDSAESICEQFAKKCINIKKMKEGMDFTISWFLEVLQEFLNWICDLGNWEHIIVKNDPFWQVKIYATKVTRIISEYSFDPLRDSTFCAEILGIIAEGEKLRADIHVIPNHQPHSLIITECLRKLAAVQQELGTRHINVNGQRPEPFLLTITGAPGIGKTCFVNKFWADVTAETLDADKLDHYVANKGEYLYTFNQKDDFYSGYHGQYNMIVDELGFLKDMPGFATVWADLIQWVNVNPMNLNMAELSHKGRTFFRSKFIWASMNRKHLNNINSVEEKEAIYRRMKYTYIAVPKTKYCTEDTMHDTNIWDKKTDFAKVVADNVHENFDFLEFHRITSCADGTYESVPISVTQLMDVVLTESQRRVAIDVAQISAINKSVDDIIARRKKFIKQSDNGCTKCPLCNKKICVPTMTDVEEMFNYLGLKDSFELFGCGYDRKTFMQDAFERMYTIPGNIGYTGCLSDATTLDDWWNSFLTNACSNSIHRFTPPAFKILGNFGEALRRGLVLCAQILVGYGAIKSIVWLFDWIRSYFTDDDKDGVVYQGDGNYASREKRISKTARPRFKPKVFITQSGYDPNAANIAVKLVNRNIWRYKIKSKHKPTSELQGCVLVIQNNFVLMPQHFIDQWSDVITGDGDTPSDPDVEITFYNCQLKNKTSGETKFRQFTRTLRDLLPEYCTDENVYYGKIYGCTSSENDDVGIFHIPGITGPNIVKLFRSRDDKLPLDHKGILATVNRDISAVYHTGPFKTISNVTYHNGDWACASGLVYDIPTRKGDCGSPFLIMDKSSESKIAAIHIGGVGNVQGLGIVVDRESIAHSLEFVSTLTNVLKDVGTESLHPDVQPLIVNQGGYVEEGKPIVECKLKSIPQMRKTKLIPSPINGLIKDYLPKTKPAMLYKQGSVDPLEMAKWGYGTSFCRPHRTCYLAACDLVTKQFFDVNIKLEDAYRRPLTNEEAVMGLPGEEFLDPINRKTSPGWPMKHLLPQGSKRSAFGTDEFDFEGPWAKKVFEHVQHLEDTIMRGERPFVVSNHFLKDELRKLEKVELGKTRLISSADLIFSIALGKYTLMFCCYMMKGRIQNGSALGVNPFSDEWTTLAFYLGNDAPNWRLIAGDWSSFDKSLAPDEIWFVKSLMNIFYADDIYSRSYRIRNALMDELAQSRHLCGEEVYSWMGANASGHRATSPVNTLAARTLIFYVILLMHPKKPRTYSECVEVMKDISENVRVVAFGDDTMIAVQMNSGYDWLTEDVIRRGFELLGMIYTNETKTGTTIAENRRLSDCTFLKRSFIRTKTNEPRRWMAALSIDTILESIQWTKDHDVGYKFWKDNISNMLKELSAHDRDIFDKWSRRINLACRDSDEKYQVPLLGYREYQELFVTTENYY